VLATVKLIEGPQCLVEYDGVKIEGKKKIPKIRHWFHNADVDISICPLLPEDGGPPQQARKSGGDSSDEDRGNAPPAPKSPNPKFIGGHGGTEILPQFAPLAS
jgi:hypothetical protein